MEATDSPTYTPLLEARITEPVEIDMASLGHYIPEWAGRERIGVNMEVLAEVARIMRMRSLTVLGMRENGEEEIVVQGVFEDGSATGAASENVTFRNRVSDSGPRPLGKDLKNFDKDCGRESDFRDFVVRLNLASLEHRIVSSEGTARDPKLWMDFIDQELSRELRRLAWKRFKPNAHKMEREASYPLLEFCRLAVMPPIRASKGDWDLRGLLSTVGVLSVCHFLSGVINNTMASATILYLALMVSAKHQEWILKKRAKYGDPYDPVTSLTLANFEWDRLLEVRQLLSRYKLVALLKEIEENN